MAGALDALGVGVGLMDADGRIIACCSQFERLVDRPLESLLDRPGRDLAYIEDRRRATELMAQMWRTGESFTALVRRTDGQGFFESHVVRLSGGDRPLAFSVIRRVEAPSAQPFPSSTLDASAPAYIADLGHQLSLLATAALLPITAELLDAAAANVAVEGAAP